MDFKQSAFDIAEELIDFRRDLHRHPELGFEEFRTTEKICEKLEEYGIEYRRISPTGVIADLNLAPSGRRIALRADMDALPITEESGLPFASQEPGKMHACGHDIHTTMLLGAARLLNENRDAIRAIGGNVRFIFQPSEESVNGAKFMIKQGALEGCDAIIAQHVGNMFDAGQIGLALGPSHAACVRFEIRVHGHTCHGGRPHEGRDAILAASAIVLALQTLASRINNPSSPLVVSVGKFQSGNAYNIIAGEALLEGTCRYYDKVNDANLQKNFESVVQGVAAGYGCTADVVYSKITPPLVNDLNLGKLIWKNAEEIFGPENVHEAAPGMGAEDFANYIQIIPGFIARLGTGSALPGGHEGLHSSKAVFDEKAIPLGTALLAQSAFQYLDSPKK